MTGAESVHILHTNDLSLSTSFPGQTKPDNLHIYALYSLVNYTSKSDVVHLNSCGNDVQVFYFGDSIAEYENSKIPRQSIYTSPLTCMSGSAEHISN